MIVVVAGVAGSGKTTVGMLIAKRLNCVFADGDDFHPAANVAKMHAGVPLTDDDRWPWLGAIAAWMDERAAAGESAVVACSVLRRAYREVLLTARARPRMMFLVISHDASADRLDSRHGHFFGRDLLDSQFATLELPEPPEPVELVQALGTPDQVADRIMALLAHGNSSSPNYAAAPAQPRLASQAVTRQPPQRGPGSVITTRTMITSGRHVRGRRPRFRSRSRSRSQEDDHEPAHENDRKPKTESDCPNPPKTGREIVPWIRAAGEPQGEQSPFCGR